MKIVVELPEDVAQRADPGRVALEALVIAGYRSGDLSHFQPSELLGFTRFAFDGFLKERGIFDHAYSAEDLDRDLAVLEKLQHKG